MTTVYLDLETRSTVDLRKTGVYIYAADPTTDVILACWALDRGPVQTWYAGQLLPVELIDAIQEGARVVAHNATFERILHRDVLKPRYGWPEIRLDQWDDTMARGRAMGLPGSLDGALGAMSAPFTKDREGHSLMLRMCKPRKIEEDGTVTWWEDKARMDRLAAYCAVDVQGERWLDLRLPALDENEREIWEADQRLNDRGVPIDRSFLDAAILVSNEASAALDAEMRKVTGGNVLKASNVSKLRDWLIGLGVQIQPVDDDVLDDEEDATPELRKNDVERLLAGKLPDGPARRALEIRLEAGKSSVKKIDAMLRRISPDGRVRGMLSYWGAGPGRWSAAGSGIQLQNLPRDGVKDWERAFAAVQLGAGTVDAVEGAPLDTLSRMLRGAIKAPGGRDLIFADLASVEARGVAWTAGQNDLVRDFASGAKMYEKMGSIVFNMPAESIGKDSFERFIGKGLVLGSGYQMGPPKFVATCAKVGREVSLELGERGIYAYRETYPRIPQLWYDMQDAAISAVKYPGKVFTAGQERISFCMFKKWLQMTLPSGRKISYRDPSIEFDDKFKRDALTYMGVDSKTKRWGKQRTYGGRLTENAVQGLCRDLIACRLTALERAGYAPILLVHDETITEQPEGHGSKDEMIAIMTSLPPWAAGFPLAAEGKRSQRYSK